MLDMRARPDVALPTAPAEAVLKRGYLPPDVNLANTPGLNVYVNQFPLGDIENFSVARASYAMAQEKLGHRSAWLKYAPWEHAYNQALTKAMGDQVSGQDGAYLAPEQWGTRLFDLLRSFSALDQLPITRIRVPSRTLRLPKVSGDITIQYPGENAQITSSQFSFGQLSFSAHKADALYNESNELFRDAPEIVDQALRLSASRAFAISRDTQAFTGQGGTNPTGIVNLPQVPVYYPNTSVTGTISTTPAAFTPSYQHVGQLIGLVEILGSTANVTAGQTECDGIVAHSRFKQTVWSSARFQDTQARPIWLTALDQEGGLFGVKWGLTNALPSNLTVASTSGCSYLIAGSWSNYALFECTAFTFEATPFAQGFASDQTQVRMTYRYDCGPVHPEAFIVLAGVLV